MDSILISMLAPSFNNVAQIGADSATEQRVSRYMFGCPHCSLRRDCPILGSTRDIDAMWHHGLRPQRMRLAAGEHLYWRNDAFEALFLVVAGSLKSYNVDLEGKERVRGFHFTGDLVGFDGIEHRRHRCQTRALENSEVCRLRFDQLMHASIDKTNLQTVLFRQLSRAFVRAEVLAGDYTATERMAMFILEIAGDGEVARSVHLSMPRRDIANYLRLATETVSRVLTGFRRASLIACRARQIEILDRDALAEIAEPALSN